MKMLKSLSVLVLFLLFTSSSASILDMQYVGEDGIYVAYIRNSPREMEKEVVLSLLSHSGELIWQKEIATVRSDAAGASIAPSFDGGILTATAYGTGYTDILLTRWSKSGEILNTDSIAYDCYDAPHQLVPFDEGYLLLWDSWSDERGLHLAVIDTEGDVTETAFVLETMHPAPSTLSVSDSFFVVSLSPTVTMEGISLLKYSGLDSTDWSRISQIEHEFNPCYSRDLLVESSGKITVMWELAESIWEFNKCVIAEYSLDGNLVSYSDSTLAGFTNVVYAKLLPNGKMILLEQSLNSIGFHIVLADIQGNELMRIPIDYNFTPATIDYLPDEGFLVTGRATEVDELILVNDAGEVLWSSLLQNYTQ